MKKIVSVFSALIMAFTMGMFSAQATASASAFTKIVFTDGGENLAETPMTLSQWKKTTIGAGNYNGSNITSDGYLEIRGACAGEIQGMSPNIVIPENYLAEMKAVFASRYNHNAAIRFMTIGSVNYYFTSTYIGNNQVKYGIGTDATIKKDMNGQFIDGATTQTLASADATALAAWNIEVRGTSVTVQRNGEAFITYDVENANGETVTPKLDCVFYSYAGFSADTAKKAFNIYAMTVKREPSAIERAESEMTCTLLHNDFETDSEPDALNSATFTSHNTAIDSVAVTQFDSRSVLEITQEAKSENIGRTTAVRFKMGEVSDYVIETVVRGGDILPDSFALRYRNSGVDGANPQYYALGYTRWGSASLGITKPNNFTQLTDYKTQFTSYDEEFIKQWHTYKIVVSGMTAATYIDGALVDEQTLAAGYETGDVSLAIFDQWHTSKISLYIDEITIKTNPVNQTRIHNAAITKTDNTTGEAFVVAANVLASNRETAQSAKMVVGVYEKSGDVYKLANVKFENIALVQGGVSEACRIIITELDPDKEYVAHLCIWNSLGNLVPLTSSVKLNVG